MDNPWVMIWMNQSDEFTVVFIWAAVVLSPKGSNCGITFLRKFLVVWRSLAVSPPDCTLLGTARSVSTWEFSSGPTPGPAEVTGHKAASGKSALRTVGCPEGGGDQQARLHIASVLQVPLCCPTLGSDCAVFARSPQDVHTQLRKLERYMHTGNQKIQEPQVCSKAGLSLPETKPSIKHHHPHAQRGLITTSRRLSSYRGFSPRKMDALKTKERGHWFLAPPPHTGRQSPMPYPPPGKWSITYEADAGDFFF